MRGRILFFLAILWTSGAAGEVVDRVEIAVGKRVITRSDIELRIRLTAFQNRDKPDFGLKARREAARRLIDQRIIEREMDAGHYPRIGAPPADALFEAFEKQNYPEGHAVMQAELAGYSVTEAELRTDLSRQADLLTFLSLRFRPTVDVTDEEVKRYFDEKVMEATKAELGLSGMRAEIEDTIAKERVDREMETWLADQRKRTKIEFPDADYAGLAE